MRYTPHIDNNYTFNASRGTLSNRSHKTNRNGSYATFAESFQYDSQDRLTKIIGDGARTHAYDNYGRITANSGIGSIAYQGGSKKYQLKSLTLNAHGNQYYQNRARQQITYNAFKKPVDIYESGKGRVNFEYGPMGNRTSAFYGGLQTDKEKRRFHKHYASIIPAEIVHDKQKNTYKFVFFKGGDAYSAPMASIEIYDNGVGSSDGGATYYLQRDYLGSIINITKQVGNSSFPRGFLQEHRHFGAWGTLDAFWSATHGSIPLQESLLDRGYTGHEHFDEVGLIHMNGRMYDAKLGRFLSPDNYIQNPYDTQNYNRYGYVLNNPLMYTDPSGEMTEDPNGGGGGWASILFGAASFIGSNWDSLGIKDWASNTSGDINRGRDRAWNNVRDWVKGWFKKDSPPSIVEIPQSIVSGDPLMNASPSVASIFTSGNNSIPTPFTSLRLFQLAAQSGITDRKQAGLAFERAALDYFNLKENQHTFQSRRRLAKGGYGSVRPDGVSDISVRSLFGSNTLRNSSLYEVKATSGILYLNSGSSPYQVLGLLDAASKSTPAGLLDRAILTFVTTADTFISSQVIQEAEKLKVTLKLSVAFENSDGSLFFSPPIPLTKNRIKNRGNVPVGLFNSPINPTFHLDPVRLKF